MWEGEQPEEPSIESRQALSVWNMLVDGMGGVNWAALQLAREYFGIDDVEGLIDRLLVIKAHKPAKDEETSPAAEGE